MPQSTAQPTARSTARSTGYFDHLFAADQDPWRFKSSWYEARKRALTLACLPEPHYVSAFEPGCANGELSAALSERCSRLLVLDFSAPAVNLARERLAGMPHVEVRQAAVPAQWPVETFDLIVISEVGYYLDLPALDALCAKVRGSLNAGGSVLACHWRWPIQGSALGGDHVHSRLRDRLALNHLSALSERDFLLDVWRDGQGSIAQREGLAPALHSAGDVPNIPA